MKMIIRQFIPLFLLLFKVICGEDIDVFIAAGDTATLPCRMSKSNHSCRLSSSPDLEWTYASGYDLPIKEVKDGRVVMHSFRSGRLSVKDDCSLLIRGVTTHDAGLFRCKPDDPNERVFLTVMTLTWSPWDSDPMKDGEGDLNCSVACWPVGKCGCGRFRWRDRENQQLPEERFSIRRSPCESTFKVLPVDNGRNYTCQYVRHHVVQIRAWHAFNFPRVNQGVTSAVPFERREGETRAVPLERSVVIGAIVGAPTLVVLLVGLFVVVFTKFKRSASQDTNVI
ncbi:uncharacterized protein LOC130907814 [Corythoichthys intestinalis]|uniref:uncharacterized protein LOC130907814 n=1 Tax=Corythoichthys intestinalis TaxID=161448 RepID=UPI0025A5AB64|nr:uncharacterized protein LOC130907814 [Corythoichthys intestinalis]XP_057679265.1 uncharacterized protein LOC130907814 [Corythoichthys intestinalis]XP_057679266.1 uncharacterized protein LOC130907814 [Corythoichthys intestinalis]XP_057679267.1 uncharacterized protein LOC130907814 [Corythoichthys intestinalis]